MESTKIEYSPDVIYIKVNSFNYEYWYGSFDIAYNNKKSRCRDFHAYGKKLKKIVKSKYPKSKVYYDICSKLHISDNVYFLVKGNLRGIDYLIENELKECANIFFEKGNFIIGYKNIFGF